MTIGPKGGPFGKKFFRNVFLLVQNDCFDEKNVFDGFKAISSIKNFFQNWSKKSLRGDHRTPNFFSTNFEKIFFARNCLSISLIVLMKQTFLMVLKQFLA